MVKKRKKRKTRKKKVNRKRTKRKGTKRKGTKRKGTKRKGTKMKKMKKRKRMYRTLAVEKAMNRTKKEVARLAAIQIKRVPRKVASQKRNASVPSIQPSTPPPKCKSANK